MTTEGLWTYRSRPHQPRMKRLSKLHKILHVDDDADISIIAALALEDVGQFTLRQCESGQAALHEAPVFSPDLFLLDYMMPDMDGQETARRLHQIPGLEDVPVVFMTARVQAETTISLLETGAIGVIPKPFDPMTLADQLRRFWQNHQTN